MTYYTWRVKSIDTHLVKFVAAFCCCYYNTTAVITHFVYIKQFYISIEQKLI